MPGRRRGRWALTGGVFTLAAHDQQLRGFNPSNRILAIDHAFSTRCPAIQWFAIYFGPGVFRHLQLLTTPDRRFISLLAWRGLTDSRHP